MAIKVIREDFAESPEALARFRREVETVRAVRSAFTANLIDASLDVAPYWLATEYVPGPTLVEAVRERGPVPAATCLRLFAALAEALASVHAYGVMHRDLKPHNIILSSVGPKLIDFGIARGAEQTALTQAGTAPGTPGYTAPEIITRNDVTAAADVFALGATIAAAATGRPPYGEGSSESVTYRVVHGEVDAAGVEPELAALIAACVAADPGQRPDPAEIIRRCAVTSALVDDPVYQALSGAGGIPSAPPGPVATPTYIPTLIPSAPTATRSRSKVALTVGAAAVALAVTVGLIALFDGDSKGGAASAGGGKDAAGPAVTPSAASSSAPSAAPSGKEPAHLEATAPNRDYWTPQEGSTHGEGACQLPAEERAEQFQFSVVNAENPNAGEMSGKVNISFRFKYATPAPGKPYYVSVAVKPPHEIDAKTGKPFEGLRQQNLDLGYTSKPVDLMARTDGYGSSYVELTYPDDFQQYVQGKPYAAGIPVTNDPGNWTVLFEHVKGPKEYASIACYGFTAK